MTDHYAAGTRVEREIIHDLIANGYQCARSAGSKGSFDAVAIKVGQILLINIKRTTPPGPDERARLWRLHCMVPSVTVPLVALKPSRKPIEYRRLTGTGPRDWAPWSPDFADEVPA